MIKWDALPREIRVLILRAFCSDIIDEYKSVSSSIRDSTHAFVVPNRRLAWPPAPPPLKLFMAAITSCRDFNEIIVHQILFGGISPPAVLKKQQHDSVAYVSGRKLAGVDVTVLYQATGCFWKNRDIANKYLRDILNRSSKDFARLLLPHVEPWLKTQFSVRARRSGPPEQDMRLGHFLDPRRKNLLIHFEVRWGSRSHQDQIGTVESLSTDRVESLAQHDIAQSAGEQWWLFLPLGHDLFDGGREWIFVNYRKQRMYVHPNASESFAWKGRDIYDMRTWASLTNLDELRDFDSNR